MILLPSPVFVGYSGYFVLAVLCFSIIAFGQRQRQRQLRGQLGMRQQQATLPPDAALQMMQTVGLPSASFLLLPKCRPAASLLQATRRKAQCRTAVAPTRRGRPSAVRRWRRHCGPGSGGGDSACRRRGSRNRVRDRSTRRLRQWRSGRRHVSDHDGHRAAGRGRRVGGGTAAGVTAVASMILHRSCAGGRFRSRLAILFGG